MRRRSLLAAAVLGVAAASWGVALRAQPHPPAPPDDPYRYGPDRMIGKMEVLGFRQDATRVAVAVRAGVWVGAQQAFPANSTGLTGFKVRLELLSPDDRRLTGPPVAAVESAVVPTAAGLTTRDLALAIPLHEPPERPYHVRIVLAREIPSQIRYPDGRVELDDRISSRVLTKVR